MVDFVRVFEDDELLSFCRVYLKKIAEADVRPGDMMLLRILCCGAGACTPATLATQMGVSKPMVTARLAVLMRAGYVVRVPSPVDGRSVYVLPTKKCIELMKNNRVGPLEKISKKMGQKKFERFLELVSVANSVLVGE